jgi:hypothetical protein
MFKVAWDKAFTRERNTKGLEKEGILPRFSRRDNYHFNAELDAAEANGATPPSTEGRTSRATEAQLLLMSGESSPTTSE